MKTKRRAVRTTISIPADLKDLMDEKRGDFNWSAIAVMAFEKAIANGGSKPRRIATARFRIIGIAPLSFRRIRCFCGPRH